jgi:hypothetical protein
MSETPSESYVAAFGVRRAIGFQPALFGRTRPKKRTSVASDSGLVANVTVSQTIVVATTVMRRRFAVAFGSSPGTTPSR